ncbi:MAG: AAA family ATPase [Bacteroidota bacterium]
MAKYPGWRNFPTIQFREIIAELESAKDEQKALMLIADTGLGKTNAIKTFQAKGGKHTYVFTLGDSYNLLTLLNEVLSVFGLNVHRWKNAKNASLKKISQRLNEIADQGGKPVFILDEAENARIPVLKAVKELYDAIVGKCGLVLIGTDQLINQLNKKAHGQSVPQLRRRFKAGTRFITDFNKDKDMKPFFDAYLPGEEDLKDLLVQLCDNYGELHDYLDPFLRHCDRKNMKPTEEALRLYHKIPKTKTR